MRSPEPTYVAIGNFDGVHRGHATVIESCVVAAAERNLRPTLLTFDPHPARVLGRAAPAVLTSVPRKVELLRERWPTLHVVVAPFTLELAALTAAEFAERVLVEQLGARAVVVGENFRFGRGRSGDLALLRELGDQLGFEARALPLYADALGTISSSRIRDAIAQGDVTSARQLLGRPHALAGVVVVGDQRGRQLGFPTANLTQIVEAPPARGVYCGWAEVLAPDGSRGALQNCVANLGVRPTFDAGPSTEVHLLDFDGDLYGQSLRLHLLARLRAEQRFGSVGELQAQLRADVQAARQRLAADQ